MGNGTGIIPSNPKLNVKTPNNPYPQPAPPLPLPHPPLQLFPRIFALLHRRQHPLLPPLPRAGLKPTFPLIFTHLQATFPFDFHVHYKQLCLLILLRMRDAPAAAERQGLARQRRPRRTRAGN